MKRRVRTLLLLLLAAASARAETLSLHGFVSVRGGGATGPDTWMQSGFGRFDVDNNATAVGDIALDWKPSKYFLMHAHGLARAEPSSYGGERGGLVAAYAQGRVERGRHDVQLRAGMFFLPTSRENRGDLWTSPYAISFSAWNTWIGQEFRPIGADLQWRFTTEKLNTITFGGTVFRGNDTMGSLLAWRGWTVGQRLSVLNESVPLPPLASLPKFIPAQRTDATTPFTKDLDGNNGFAARTSFAYGDRAFVQFTHVDNGGDNLVHGDEYAWETVFDVIGAEIGNSDTTVFLVEAATGRTSMGRITPVQPNRYANVDFTAGYGLISHRRGANRFTARLDAFRNTDRDGSPGENNDEDGLSWTFAYLRDVTSHIRAGIEFTQVSADRPDGSDPDGRSLLVELRLRY